MTLHSILYKIFGTLLFLLLIYTVINQYKNMKKSARSASSSGGACTTLFISISVLSLLAISIEILDNYQGERDIKDFNPCDEMNRVCWRRAMSLSFIILLILNNFYYRYEGCLTAEAINITIFFLIFFLLYFYFNWDQYHRYTTTYCSQPCIGGASSDLPAS